MMHWQEDLIGHGQDKAGDERRRLEMHQQWLEQQDQQHLAKLMDSVRNGFRRKRAGDILLDEVRTSAFCWWPPDWLMLTADSRQLGKSDPGSNK